VSDTEDARARLVRKALFLQYLVIVWNVVEAGIGLNAGLIAGSVALVGFGLDSVIEVAAASTLVWRLKKHCSDPDEETRAEKMALKIIGGTFFLLSAYVSVESTKALWLHEVPKESSIGIALAVASALIMPVLGLKRRWLAVELQSKALAADAMETMICAGLSVILLVGLALNSFLGWWWADPVAGFLMVAVMVKEGREAWKGSCCC
jgi:divalent metal cation (Fe/Co/Zn/Cd) transporter